MRRHSTTRTTTLCTGASRPRRVLDPTASPFEQISAAANAAAANSDELRAAFQAYGPELTLAIKIKHSRFSDQQAACVM